MTLPASFPLSMSQIATELGLSLPLSLTHPWVLLLNGGGPPVSFSQLLGLTGRFDGNEVITGSGFNYAVSLGGAPFFSGTLNGLSETTASANLQLVASSAPNWTGNVFVKDNTTGLSKVLAFQGGSPPTWGGASGGGAGGIGIFGNTGQTHSFTILPST